MITNNKAYMIGKIAKKPVFSHEVYGEGFYIFHIEAPRKSGNVDTLPVVVSERLVDINRLDVDRTVVINGQIRSYNQHIDGTHSHLILSIFAGEIDILEDVEIPLDTNNSIEIVGHLCKAPTYRTTPQGREVCDIMMAVNRAYGKSDYIPCIVWGRNARFAGRLEAGEHIQIQGRFQSREYAKKISDNEVETRTAYEVSVSKIDYADEGEANVQ